MRHLRLQQYSADQFFNVIKQMQMATKNPLIVLTIFLLFGFGSKGCWGFLDLTECVLTEGKAVMMRCWKGTFPHSSETMPMHLELITTTMLESLSPTAMTVNISLWTAFLPQLLRGHCQMSPQSSRNTFNTQTMSIAGQEELRMV
ncbi:hypothetical protein ANANG_G00137640 [Anguilla anguilla]|uniref:Uncharacterized protein n=1 Tax=Anguilla anguilla TaxID=7936 RepID=A0A9D3RW59_ANGAN|nr:hypothetical protein ANANG_G00137640 [Anguilla anguilla]